MIVHDWTDELDDFADTAALVAELDLVISVDTSVVHVAGAMGRPIWLLNRFNSCWRWMIDRERSPWYGSLRQFKQQRPGDWDGVFDQVKAALADRLADRA
jgi:ADP-heptose:LPS heptosyltransferase